MPTGPIRTPNKNGIRQPHACRSEVAIEEVSKAPKPAPNIPLRPWLANCQLAMKPRRSGSCSTRNAVELPNSPPAENPCTRREDDRDRRQHADGLVGGHQ